MTSLAFGAQGLDGCFLFPTRGVGVEEGLKHDPEDCAAAFRACNRWLDNSTKTGASFQDRVFAAPPRFMRVDVDDRRLQGLRVRRAAPLPFSSTTRWS